MSGVSIKINEAKQPSKTDINSNLIDEPYWNRGPDEVMPAESFFSCRLDMPFKIKQLNIRDYPPMSVYTMFKRTVEKNPNYNALAYKVNDTWNFISYLNYWKMCHRAAKSFIKLGLDANCCVAILGFNAPAWFISLLGAMFAGGVGCGVYTTNSVETCEYILKDSKAKIVVVEDSKQLEKMIQVSKNVKLNAIIQYSGEITPEHRDYAISWNKFIELGDDLPNEILAQRISTIAPNKCASLIYTSGTTGMPKAAMISHDSITYLVRNIGIDQIQLNEFSERLISYLPLSHIAAQLIDCYQPLRTGATVYFASPDALKGSLVNTLQEVRPTLFFGVPRIWEKIYERMEKVITSLTGAKLKLFQWARNVTYEHMTSKFNGYEKFSPCYKLAKNLVLNKIHKQLGLDCCRLAISGAAPITKETLDFFISIGIPLCETYGMSETTGPHSVGLTRANRVTSCGVVDQFNQSKLDKKESDGSGELCIYGRHVFMGYLNDEKKTVESFDNDGWLHTGDIAKIDNDGFIYITGRLKELIITAGGENIAPVPIEENVKAELPQIISNCMLIGDKRKFLSLLVTLKCVVNMDTFEPMDELTQDTIKWLRSIGSKSSLVSEIVDNKDPLVYKEIENAITRANKKSISNAGKVQKFLLLSRDFSLAFGELGPTLKLRRPIVNKMYANEINELYANAKE